MKDSDLKKTSGRIRRVKALRELFDSTDFKGDVERAKKIVSRKKRRKAFIKIAEKYQLAYELGEPLLDIQTKGEIDLSSLDNYYTDVCRVYDMVDELLNPNFPRDFLQPVMKNTRMRLEFNAYPIHLGIAPNTSKRLIIEYINKNWEIISDMVNEYYDNPIKLPKRRRKEKRDNMIWNLYSEKKMKSSEIADKVSEKFPEETLTYTDINKIISRIKKRKSRFL